MENLRKKLEQMAATIESENNNSVTCTTKSSNLDSFKAILTDMYNLYERKNTDYGSSFDQSCDEFGLISPAIRMSDKLNRFKTLVKHQQIDIEQKVKDEKIEDTLIDLANYALMTILWIRNENKRKEGLGV